MGRAPKRTYACFESGSKDPLRVSHKLKARDENRKRWKSGVCAGSQPLSIATDASYGEQQLNYERSIVMWCYCRECERIVTPLVPMSDDTPSPGVFR